MSNSVVALHSAPCAPGHRLSSAAGGNGGANTRDYGEYTPRTKRRFGVSAVELTIDYGTTLDEIESEMMAQRDMEVRGYRLRSMGTDIGLLDWEEVRPGVWRLKGRP